MTEDIDFRTEFEFQIKMNRKNDYEMTGGFLSISIAFRT